MADNGIGFTQASGNFGRSLYTSRVVDSLFVGESENVGNPMTDAEKKAGRSLPFPELPDFPVRGYEFYDFHHELDNNTFVNYQDNATRKTGALSYLLFTSFGMSTENSVEGLTFVNAKPVSFPSVQRRWASDYGRSAAYRSAGRSSHPHRRGRPVVAPNSAPPRRSRSPASSWSSVGNGPSPTRVQYAFVIPMIASSARGLTPLARIVAHAGHAQEPEWFTTAPVQAIENVMKKAGWSVDDVDLFEVNEAFACVAMAPMKDLGIPHQKLNVNGGACALGHPIGASGARLVVTLLHALKARNLKRGVASLCIGGGEATAIAIELA